MFLLQSTMTLSNVTIILIPVHRMYSYSRVLWPFSNAYLNTCSCNAMTLKNWVVTNKVLNNLPTGFWSTVRSSPILRSSVYIFWLQLRRSAFCSFYSDNYSGDMSISRCSDFFFSIMTSPVLCICNCYDTMRVTSHHALAFTATTIPATYPIVDAPTSILYIDNSK